MKIAEYKNGAYVSQDLPLPISGLIVVKVYKPNGELHDKVKCYERSTAREYFKAFKAIAKNL